MYLRILNMIQVLCLKKQLLQEQGWKLVYLKLQKAIDEILKISNVEFMSLPPFSEMSKK